MNSSGPSAQQLRKAIADGVALLAILFVLGTLAAIVADMIGG